MLGYGGLVKRCKGVRRGGDVSVERWHEKWKAIDKKTAGWYSGECWVMGGWQNGVKGREGLRFLTNMFVCFYNRYMYFMEVQNF
jgi:hypothetical protein